MNLKPETLERIDKLIPRYPEKRSAALPLLHIVQEELGWISQESMEWIAEKLELEPINIYELVTFYPMLRDKPIGRRHIKVCRTLGCALNGSYEVCRILEEELTSNDPDGVKAKDYTIDFVECIASCGTAPVVQVDQKLYENIRPDCARDFAEKIREETVASKRAERQQQEGN